MRYILLSALFLLLSACGTFPKEEQYSIPLEHFGKNNTAPNSADLNDYVLQPEDVLDVLFHFDTLSTEIYRVAPHDKLSVKFLSASEYDGIYQVRPDGYISMPFIGDLKVAGLSVNEIQQRVTQQYRPILKNPAFFISLAEYQVYIKELRQSLDHPNMGQARLLVVRDDYKISLPLVGEISVKDKSVQAVKTEANQRYEKLFQGMSVDVLLQKTHPRQIFVFGEVNNPGGHFVNSDVSLFQALALAGGPTREAELSTVVAMTQIKGEMKAKVYDLEDLINGKSDKMSTLLSPDDVIYIPRNRLSTTAQVMRSVSEIMMFRGIGVSGTYSLNNSDTRIVAPITQGAAP